MTSSAPLPRTDGRAIADRALPYLLALPIALLALPFDGWLSHFDPDPTSTATALVALALWPAALACLGAAPLRPWHPLAIAVPILVALSTVRGTDSSEGVRATVQAGILAIGFLCGTQLDPPARRTFCRALVVLALLFLVPGLFASAFGDRDALVGPFGNVGPTSQVALAGAAAGTWQLTMRRGTWRVIGAFGLAAFAWHAVSSPVLAGGIALVVSLAACVFLSPWLQEIRAARAVVASVAGALLFAVIAVGFAHRDVVDAHTVQAVEQAPTSAPDHLGGARVRGLIWNTLPAMIADGGALGRGAGQFAATYPPYRDPVERRASTSGTEVEHPHNDWLLVWVEYGWLGGLLATAVLIVVLGLALAGLRKQEVATNALGAALLALLVNAGAHSVLLGNPAAGLIAAVACGACSTASRGDRPSLARRSRASLATCVLALAIAVPSYRQWQLGAALADFAAASANASEHGVDADFGGRLDSAVARAVDACPDNVLARSIECSLAIARARAGIDTEVSIEHARAACAARLDARPDSPSALTDLGWLELFEDRPGAARAAWQRVLEIERDSPEALRNLARLELEWGDPETAFDLFDRLELTGGPSEREFVAVDAIRMGLPPDRAARLLRRDPTMPTQLFARAEEAGDDFGTALAQHLFAREHLDRGAIDNAVRSLRQAQRSYLRADIDARLVVAELACAEWLVDRIDTARELREGLAPREPMSPPLALHEALASAAAELDISDRLGARSEMPGDQASR